MIAIVPLFAATAAIRLFPPPLASPGGEPFVWWGVALSSGALLAALARRRGMTANATITLAGVAVVITSLFVFPRSAFPQQTEWKDPSPHATRFVTVEEGVQLEVLDWGGSGPPRSCCWRGAELSAPVR